MATGRLQHDVFLLMVFKVAMCKLPSCAAERKHSCELTIGFTVLCTRGSPVITHHVLSCFCAGVVLASAARLAARRPAVGREGRPREGRMGPAVAQQREHLPRDTRRDRGRREKVREIPLQLVGTHSSLEVVLTKFPNKCLAGTRTDVTKKCF